MEIVDKSKYQAIRRILKRSLDIERGSMMLHDYMLLTGRYEEVSRDPSFPHLGAAYRSMAAAQLPDWKARVDEMLKSGDDQKGFVVQMLIKVEYFKGLSYPGFRDLLAHEIVRKRKAPHLAGHKRNLNTVFLHTRALLMIERHGLGEAHLERLRAKRKPSAVDLHAEIVLSRKFGFKAKFKRPGIWQNTFALNDIEGYRACGFTMYDPKTPVDSYTFSDFMAVADGLEDVQGVRDRLAVHIWCKRHEKLTPPRYRTKRDIDKYPIKSLRTHLWALKKISYYREVDVTSIVVGASESSPEGFLKRSRLGGTL